MSPMERLFLLVDHHLDKIKAAAGKDDGAVRLAVGNARWEIDCLRWRGRKLTGEHAHWCHEWDGLPVDETTEEWPCKCWEET